MEDFQRRLLWHGMFLFLLGVAPAAAAAQNQSQNPPPLSGLRPRTSGGGCRFDGPLLYIPSRSGGTTGLVVRVSAPEKARYVEGAPIAVHMESAIPRVDGAVACLSEQGFIDISFLCPGAQYRSPDGTIWKSGGGRPGPPIPDPFGCIEPLADVLSFATGQIRSLDSKSVQDYTGSIHALSDDAGVIGWSFGGNLAVLAMARHGERFPSLKWYASWESPFLGTTEDRGSIAEANPFYHADTGKIDFDRLRYDSGMPVWVFPPLPVPPGPNWPRGALYLDGDGNGVFNKETDVAFWAGADPLWVRAVTGLDPGPQPKAYYSPLVTREAANRKVFGDRWPSHIATLAEVEQLQVQIDPLRHVSNAIRKLPRLAVLVFESQQNHVIEAADHPQAVAQVDAWLDAHARWVRFNPDAHYLEWVMGRKSSREVQYPAGKKIDRHSIQKLLEPEDREGGPTDKQGMTAAVCELADRTYRNDWKPVLAQVLNLQSR